MILELGQSLSSFEWVRVTAEYSNAVLVAIMPFISDVAEKLDLPVSQPVTVGDVVQSTILPSTRVGAEVVIKGGWVFAFDRGYIRTIQSDHSYYVLQNPDDVPMYFGEDRISRTEAVRIARDTLKKLGIPLESVFAEQEPQVAGPPKTGRNIVPHYYVVWPDPRGRESVHMEINGNTKRVERIALRNRNLERPPPKTSVTPPRDPNQPHFPLVNPEYAWRLIPVVLHAIDDYGSKLSLSVPRPLTTNHVARFSVGDNGGWPHCEIELTNGWRFIFRNSMVNGYYAPDNLFNSDQRPILIKDFTGKWNMTESEAIELVRRTLSKLNYPTNLVHTDFKPQKQTPTVPNIPRYSFWWWFENETHDDLQSKVEAEVDADKRELKSLYYDDKAYWGHPPPIDVPITVPLAQTNAASTRATSPSRRAPPTPPLRPLTPFKTPEEFPK